MDGFHVSAEGRNTRQQVIYRASLGKPKPVEYGDCRDRIDDLRFSAQALSGLIHDARARHVFDASALDALDVVVRKWVERIELTRPTMADPNGHA